jgi:hypothetical protein
MNRPGLRERLRPAVADGLTIVLRLLILLFCSVFFWKPDVIIPA